MTCKRILLGLALLLMAAGAASAQSSCPECDEDGKDNPNNTYHNIDVGFVENKTEALVDTDVAHSHEGEDSGFWAWLSICLHAFLGHIEEALGIDSGVDANAEAFVSDEGVDLDATLYVGAERVDFDESAVGDLDGQTWEAMKPVANLTRESGLPTGTPDYQGLDVDVCVTAELGIIEC